MEDVKGRTAFITGGSRAVETFKLDVRDRGGYARVADEAEARLGPVSILCNNAGVAAATRFTYEFWDWMLAVRRPLHNPPRRSSPLPVRERIEGEGPYSARDFFARDSRFRFCSESARRLRKVPLRAQLSVSHRMHDHPPATLSMPPAAQAIRYVVAAYGWIVTPSGPVNPVTVVAASFEVKFDCPITTLAAMPLLNFGPLTAGL